MLPSRQSVVCWTAVCFCVSVFSYAQQPQKPEKSRAAASKSTSKAAAPVAAAAQKPKAPRLWSIQPVVRPEVPAIIGDSSNPIDAFVTAMYQKQGLTPV